MIGYKICISILMLIMGICIVYISFDRGEIAKSFIQGATKNRMRSSLFKDYSYDEVQKGIKISLRIYGNIFILVAICSWIL